MELSVSHDAPEGGIRLDLFKLNFQNSTYVGMVDDHDPVTTADRVNLKLATGYPMLQLFSAVGE